MTATPARPRLGVFKFASCDGCQLSLLDCEDELLAVAGRVEIAYFLEAVRRPLEGEFDLALVEGSISSVKTARPGSHAGLRRNMGPAMSRAWGPDKRTTPMPPRPGGVAMATMVSSRFNL